MPNNILLNLRGDYELVTRYGSKWMTQILNTASASGLPYIDLSGSQATRTNYKQSFQREYLY